MYYYHSMTNTQKKILVHLRGVEPMTFRLLGQMLSYRKLVGAETIKLGSCNKHPTYGLD